MEDEIAKTEMVGIYPDQGEIGIVARIGRPFRMPTGEWACPTAIDGLYGSLKNVYGEDGIQAVSLALGLVYKLLSGFIEKEGHRLVDPREREDIPLEAIFGREQGERHQIRNGKIEDAASILKSAAARLIARGEKLWDLADMDVKSLIRRYHPDDFYVYYENGMPVATMMVTFVDKEFWPDVVENESGFVHKLAVAEEYAGKNKPRKLIEHAMELCRERGIRFLRLDCGADRKKLRFYYENMGFKKVDQRMVGTFDTIFYELKL